MNLLFYPRILVPRKYLTNLGINQWDKLNISAAGAYII